MRTGLLLAACRRPPAPGRGMRGFSLIELVVAIVLLGILAAAAAPIFSSALQSYVEISDRLATLSKARYATERIARELREVSYAGGAYTFAAMNPTNVSFTKIDGTIVTIAAAPPNVTLGYSTVAGGARVLSDELSALGFVYRTNTGAPGAVPASVAFVEVSLTLAKGGVNHTQRTRVALRNH